MNCTRLKSRSSAAATALTSSVLAMPGTPFEQHVAADEQRGDEAGERALLADDDLADLVAHAQHGVAGRRCSAVAIARRRSMLSRLWARVTSWRMASTVWARITSSSSLGGRRAGRRGAHTVAGDAGAGAAADVGHVARRAVRRQAQPVGQGAAQVVAEQRGRVGPSPGPLEEAAHRGHQLGPRDLHGLVLEHGATEAAGPPQHDDRERDDELQQRQLHVRAHQVGERPVAIARDRRLEHGHAAVGPGGEQRDREQSVVGLAETVVDEPACAPELHHPSATDGCGRRGRRTTTIPGEAAETIRGHAQQLPVGHEHPIDLAQRGLVAPPFELGAR